jgi:putative addiction module component (TIGR02574 family)
MSNTPFNYRDLPISERIQLVEDIWDSIAEDSAGELHLTDEEVAELDRRVEEYKKNPSSGVSWEEVRKTLFEG